MNIKNAVLGQEVYTKIYGVGRVMAVNEDMGYITVKPYVAGYELKFDPCNVSPWVNGAVQHGN